jgi:FkbM family methyltransferase
MEQEILILQKNKSEDAEFEKKTIDSIVFENKKHGDFNLLKIDIDGHDFEVLSGAKEFISSSKPFVFLKLMHFQILILLRTV